jgi:hypothetical protein
MILDPYSSMHVGLILYEYIIPKNLMHFCEVHASTSQSINFFSFFIFSIPLPPFSCILLLSGPSLFHS